MTIASMPNGANPDLGIPPGGPFGPQFQIDPRISQIANAPAPAKRGMFGGGGGDWKTILAAGLAGYGAQRNPGLQQALFATLAQRQSQAREEQYYRAHQQEELQRQIGLYDYQRTHPNDEVTQYMVAAGIDPHSPQGQAIYNQALQQKTNPFAALDVTGPDGSTQRQFVRPPMAPTAPVGPLTPLGAGGPTPPASGGFPPHY